MRPYGNGFGPMYDGYGGVYKPHHRRTRDLERRSQRKRERQRAQQTTKTEAQEDAQRRLDEMYDSYDTY